MRDNRGSRPGDRSIRGIGVPVLISLRINKRHGYISRSLAGSLNIRAIPAACRVYIPVLEQNRVLYPGALRGALGRRFAELIYRPEQTKRSRGPERASINFQIEFGPRRALRGVLVPEEEQKEEEKEEEAREGRR